MKKNTHFFTIRMFRKAGSPIKFICIHLFGKHHKFGHKAFVGGVVMVIGVLVANVVATLHPNHAYRLGCDLIGYGIHGIGLSPFLEAMVQSIVDDGE